MYIGTVYRIEEEGMDMDMDMEVFQRDEVRPLTEQFLICSQTEQSK